MTETWAYWSIGILVTVIIFLMGYILTRKPREVYFKTQALAAKEKISNFKQIQNDLESKCNKLTETNNKQEIQITEQERKLGIFSKYTFDPRMSFFRLGNKGYCSICMFAKFEEKEIGIPGNQFKCPSCGTDYSRSAGIVVINPNIR